MAKKNKDTMKDVGLPVPDSVFEDKPTEAKSDHDITVVESYFSAFEDRFDPGLAFDGTILNHRNYVKTEIVDGEPVEYRWGSRRKGFPERNKHKGYVEARVNPETGELDPKGRPVVVGEMVLLVRRKKHGDVVRGHLKELATRKNTEGSRGSEAYQEARDIARKHGLEKALEEHYESYTKEYFPNSQE